jgi:hypothetical protein
MPGISKGLVGAPTVVQFEARGARKVNYHRENWLVAAKCQPQINLAFCVNACAYIDRCLLRPEALSL